MIRMKFTGVHAVDGRISTLVHRFPTDAMKALLEEAKIEKREVDARTPVDTGDLKKTNRIEGPVKKGTVLTIYLKSGNDGVPYAVYVHENLEAFHRVGQAKYLESVLLESAPHLMRRVAARLQLKSVS
jgi:hypothetical protein